jgi:hypothetical protein
MDEIQAAQYRAKRRNLVSTAENVRVPSNRVQYLTIRGLFSFSRRTLIHLVSGPIIEEDRGRSFKYALEKWEKTWTLICHLKGSSWIVHHYKNIITFVYLKSSITVAYIFIYLFIYLFRTIVETWDRWY